MFYFFSKNNVSRHTVPLRRGCKIKYFNFDGRLTLRKTWREKTICGSRKLPAPLLHMQPIREELSHWGAKQNPHNKGKGGTLSHLTNWMIFNRVGSCLNARHRRPWKWRASQLMLMWTWSIFFLEALSQKWRQKKRARWSEGGYAVQDSVLQRSHNGYKCN